MKSNFRLFKNEPNDSEYFNWMDTNPNGYVLVPKRNSKSGDFKYHRSRCKHMYDLSPKFSFTTKGKVKVCSNNLEELKEWIKKYPRFNGVFNPCSSCNH